MSGNHLQIFGGQSTVVDLFSSHCALICNSMTSSSREDWFVNVHRAQVISDGHMAETPFNVLWPPWEIIVKGDGRSLLGEGGNGVGFALLKSVPHCTCIRAASSKGSSGGLREI